MINEVTDSTWEALVVQADRPVIVELWAEWCGPCKFQGPIIEDMAEKYADSIDFYKMDIDANPDTYFHYGIMSIPTTMYAPHTEGDIYRTHKAVGLHSLEKLEEKFGFAPTVS